MNSNQNQVSRQRRKPQNTYQHNLSNATSRVSYTQTTMNSFNSSLALIMIIIKLVLVTVIGFGEARIDLDLPESSTDSAMLKDEIAEVTTLPTGSLDINFDSRRPIWNLAHMVNSIKELDYRLSKGANGVEADVTFGRDGMPLYTYHGAPCDCLRHCHQQESFDDYLAYVNRLVNEPDEQDIGKNLTLLFLDLKLDQLDQRAKVRAGHELAKSVMRFLFKEPDEFLVAEKSSAKRSNNLRLILSVNHVTDSELIHNFIHLMEISNSSNLMSRIGFDVGMNDDLQLIESMWRRLGGQERLNIWQGDGYTNCLSPFYNLRRLSQAVQKRDLEKGGYPRKIYQWTIDLHDRIRDSLKLGVDAVMTNHPERVVSILQEPEMVHRFRLASNNDDPFKRVIIKARDIKYARDLGSVMTSRSMMRSGLLSSLVDVIYSIIDYIREIPFLSYPTTFRTFSASRSLATIRSIAPQMTQERKRLTGTPSRLPISSVGQPKYMIESTYADPNISSNSSTEISSTKPTNASMIIETVQTASITGTGRLYPCSNSTTEAVIDNSTSLSTSVEARYVGNSETQALNNTMYEEPKWYVSLVSNLLLSSLKLALPTNS